MNAPLRYTLDVTTTRGMVHVGDCLAWLRSLPDESVDAVVTDPPYGLGREPDPREVLSAWLAGDEYKPGGSGFMGRAWDAFVPSPCVWQECLRAANASLLTAVQRWSDEATRLRKQRDELAELVEELRRELASEGET